MFRNLLYFLVGAALLAGMGWWSHDRYHTQFLPQPIAAEIYKNTLSEISELDREANILKELSPAHPSWSDVRHSFLLIDSTTVIAWSNEKFVPEFWPSKDAVFFSQSSRGDFLVKQWKLPEGRWLIGSIPLAERFKVSNQYIHNTWNRTIFPIDGIQIIPPSHSLGIKIGRYFNIGDEFLISQLPFDTRTFYLVSICLGFLLGALLIALKSLHRGGYHDCVFLLLFFSLLALRLGMIYTEFPASLGYWSLFDPQKFASSSLNVSLGDFLLNSLVVFCCSTYLFVFHSRFKLFAWLAKANAFAEFIGSTGLLTVAFFSFLFPFLFYEIIFHNSSIHLDITQFVYFDALRVVAFVCVLLGTLSSFMFCHVCVNWVKHLQTKKKFAISLLAAAAIFMVYSWASNHDYSISFVIAFFYLALLFFSGLTNSLSKIGFISFSYFLLAIAAYSIQGGLTIRFFSSEATRQSQFRFANNSLVNHDILGEYILYDASRKVSHDLFIQSRLSTPFLPKGVIRQRVQQLYINAYFDRYDVNVYLFDAAGEGIGNQTTDGLASSIQNVQKFATKTEYEGVYWLKESKARSIKRYLNVIPIYKSNLVGFVLIDLTLKKVAPLSVYPELLIDNRFSQFLNTGDFSYGFYSNGKLIASSGEFNYDRQETAKQIADPIIFTKGLNSFGYDHIAVEDDEGKVVVVSARRYQWFFVAANFAFWFLLGLALVFAWILLYTLYSFSNGNTLNYSSRIQLYIYAAFIVPLVVLAIATLSVTNRTSEWQLTTSIESKSELLTETIATWMENEDSTKQVTELSTPLIALSKSSQSDISVYDATGGLLASSQPLIFDNQFLSKQMNRAAWQKIVNEKENYIVTDEQIGNLTYSSSYRALRSSTSGELLGVVNLPFFQSARAIEKSQAIVLSNVLVVFVVVFIVFNLLSLFASDWLTFPLRFITKTLGKTTLTGENKPLEWKANDEIGLMVREYNKMLSNLESSKAALARTQKESAWREMAQQVAHEIKNPLTPMKLTLQQMEQATEVDEKKKRSIKTLLEQVEILNGIATSFSSFAKMPTPVLTKVNIFDSLRKAVNLYANGSNGKVTLKAEFDNEVVLGDEQLLIRIFSNLILNGLQSYQKESDASVEVALTKKDNQCLISISDRGVGVSEEDKSKIFTPSFSTKKSGSGLGLAIAKQAIEYMNGAIWFESEVRMGAVFYIRLSLI